MGNSLNNDFNFVYNIPFNRAIELDKNFVEVPSSTSGDNEYTKKVSSWIDINLQTKSLLTTSCTHALEIIAFLIDIEYGDEIIAPSYTFVSSVNAFAIRGAKIVFVDIDPLTMNIDESLIEMAITEKTKAIVAVHYAGVSCNMDVIKHLADKYNLYIIEDAAQAMFAKYKNQYLGTIGDFGAFSFHETKNFSMGEGGALLINNKKFIEKAEIIREKGTNRSNFLKGYVDKYTWVSLGSSYLPSDILAAYLYPQLIKSSIILEKRMQLWNQYYLGLSPLKDQINLPYIPDYALHNAHIFYIKCKSETIRDDLMGYLKNLGITTVFHYVPLHSSIAGQKYGRMNGFDVFTSAESSKLLRLPLYFNLDFNDINHVVNAIFDFFKVD